MRLPEEIWNSKVIKKRMRDEAHFECSHGLPIKAHYWFTVPQGDTRRGNLELRNFMPGVLDIDPHEHQKGMARTLRESLQREAHHDGVWILGWTHPPSSTDAILEDGDNCWGRLVMIWLDEDADPQYTVESDLPIAQMISHGMQYYIDLAQQAHERWKESYGKKALKEDFGITSEQQTKKALEALN